MKKLSADCINGVSLVEAIEEGKDMKNESLFFDCLSDLSEDEEIFCTVSDETYARIEEKYGVRK